MPSYCTTVEHKGMDNWKITYLAAFDEFVFSFKLGTNLSPPENRSILFSIDINRIIFKSIQRQWHSSWSHSHHLRRMNLLTCERDISHKRVTEKAHCGIVTLEKWPSLNKFASDRETDSRTWKSESTSKTNNCNFIGLQAYMLFNKMSRNRWILQL